MKHANLSAGELREKALNGRLLITGASGLLGANFTRTALMMGWTVTCVSATYRVRSDVTRSVLADLSEPGVATALFQREQPSVVIHTAAATNVDRCERDSAYARRLNVDMAREVAVAARAVDARLIHVSTEAVFGAAGDQPYAESDPPVPCNEYGRTKLQGEVVALEVDPRALVARTTIYGWNAQAKSSLAEYFLGRLRAGRPAPGFEDAWMTPILVTDLGERLLRLARDATTGVLHLAGSECVSKADFGREVARTFGLDAGLVHSTSLSEASLAAPRPQRVCLQVTRAEALLGRMPTVGEGLARMREQENRGERDTLRSLLEEP